MSFKKTLIGLVASAIIFTGAEAKASIFSRAVNWARGNNYTSMTYQEAIGKVSTPKQAGSYCNGLNYKSDDRLYGRTDFWASFKLTHQNKAGDCDDFAVACAALLSDDGYSPSILVMRKGKKCHAVFVYQDVGKYGSAGKNSDNKSPKFESINKLVDALKYDEFIFVSLDRGDIVYSEYDLDNTSGSRFKSVYSSAFRPNLQKQRSSTSVKKSSKPEPLPLPKTTLKPRPISNPVLPPQLQFEIAKKEKMNDFNNKKERILYLIRNGRIDEAGKLTSEVKLEVQEARRLGY